MSHRTKIFFFNPGHEEALFHIGKASYTRSKAVRFAEKEFGLEPIWALYPMPWLVYYEGKLYRTSARGASLTALPSSDYPEEAEAVFWAVEPFAIARAQAWAKDVRIRLSVPAFRAELLALNAREQAAIFLREIGFRRSLIPKWVTNLVEAEQAIASLGYPLMLKRSYSSSGRGVMPLTAPEDDWGHAWLEAGLKKYGRVSVEPMLDKVKDYAAEYYVDGKCGVRLLGFNAFSTDAQGHFECNDDVSQEVIVTSLTQAAGGRSHLEDILEAQKNFIRRTIAPIYRGVLGIDMMSYRSGDGLLSLHPCIEINLRCTMGVFALLERLRKR